MSDVCPKCGAERVAPINPDDQWSWFACGTGISTSAFAVQSKTCRDRETKAAEDASLERRIRELTAEVDKFQSAIRNHRDQRGDDRCWLDDETLYKSLPEGYTPPARDVAVEIANCQKFIETRRCPATEYVSPQRQVDELTAENARLRDDLAQSQQQLAYLWHQTGSCPCGARKESPQTHPHVGGCPTAEAAREALASPSGGR